MHGDDRRTEFLFGLIERHAIRSFVETGAYAAATTRLFAPRVRRAWTCESYPPRYLECRKYCAGWNITLAGEPGKKLEARFGPALAGALIYIASTGRRQVPDFYASDEDARADIVRCAELPPVVVGEV